MAWAKTLTPACTRIEFLVRFADSAAMSTSRMRLSAAVRFSTWLAIELEIDSKRFCNAPTEARRLATVLIAVVVVVSAALAFVTVLMLDVSDKAAESMSENATVMDSPEVIPT